MPFSLAAANTGLNRAPAPGVHTCGMMLEWCLPETENCASEDMWNRE
jgi:hypothetical protein